MFGAKVSHWIGHQQPVPFAMPRQMPTHLQQDGQSSAARCSFGGLDSTGPKAHADVSPTPTLLTKQQVAKALHVTPRTVHSYINSGDLPAVKIGRSVRVTAEDLRAFIERHRIHKPPSKT